MSRLVGGAEMRNGLAHVVLKNWKGNLNFRGTLEEWGLPAPHQASQPKLPVLWREVTTTSMYETSEDYGWVRWRMVGVPGIPLKGPTHGTHWWTHSLWAPVLGQKLGRCWRHTGRNWISGFRMRDGGAAFSQTKELAASRSHCFLLGPSPTQPAHASGHSCWVCINLTTTLSLPWWFPDTSPHPTCGPPKLLPVTFPYKQPVLAHAVDFLKNLSKVYRPQTNI